MHFPAAEAQIALWPGRRSDQGHVRVARAFRNRRSLMALDGQDPDVITQTDTFSLLALAGPVR